MKKILNKVSFADIFIVDIGSTYLPRSYLFFKQRNLFISVIYFYITLKLGTCIFKAPKSNQEIRCNGQIDKISVKSLK